VFRRRRYETTRYTRAEEKLEDILDRLEPSPRKSLALLAYHKDALTSAGQNETKLLNSHSCNTSVIRKLYDTECGARLNFVNWYFQGAHATETDSRSLHLAQHEHKKQRKSFNS
jgi:hypothetical protein